MPPPGRATPAEATLAGPVEPFKTVVGGKSQGHPFLRRMCMISDEYRTLLRSVHEKWTTWGNGHPEKHLDKVLAYGARSVLDYGCGKGRLVEALRANLIAAEGYDPGVAEWSDESMLREGGYDLVVCFDVMEHVEELFVPFVLAQMASCAPNVRIDIAMRPAVKVLPDGRNAHITLKSADWWLAEINKVRPIKHIHRATEGHLELDY